jgi:CHAT domain-containing protein
VGEIDPQVYGQFQQAVEALRQIAAFERAGQRTAAPGDEGLTLQQVTANARRDLDQAVQRIRSIPGFEAFLAPPDLQDLQAAARPGQPLAYLLATSLGGLALVVHRPDPGGPVSIRPLWMDDFTDGTLRAFLVTMEDDQVAGGYLVGQIARPDWLKQSLSEDLPGVGKKLLPSLADHLQSHSASAVTLIPGGLLSLLPLHAAGAPLPSPQTGLLEHWTVRYAPSARVLAAGIRLAAEPDRSPQAAPVLAGVGNPLPADRPLAFARPELEAIAGLFAAGASHVLFEQDATLQNLKDACMGANYLHFSCHGRFEPQQALESSLILSGQERLTLRSLLDQALDLSHVRLVVLSACQTGITDFTRLPDEAAGLPAGFLQAGVPGVVSSLWLVNDLSTALLMDRFYRLHLQERLEPAEALRRAQRWLRGSSAAGLGLAAWYQQIYQRSGRRDAQAYKAMRYYAAQPDVRPFEHPYYWAGFVFSGV